MYVEICKSIKDRNHFIPLSNVGSETVDHELYISLFPFDKTILNYVDVHKTITGHKGNHYCPYILVDIDCEGDIEGGRIEAVKLVRRLNQMYNVDVNELYLYFSGGKGFHVVIPGKLYATLSPCVNMGEKIKNVATVLCDGIEYVDYKIYENHRIIRVDNSRHRKGLYKIQLSFEELSEWSISKIQKEAKTPRRFERLIYNSEININVDLNDMIQKNFVIDKDEKGTQTSGQGIFFAPPEKGNRNDQLHRQACALFTYSEFSPENIYHLISAINNSSKEPLLDSEVNQIVFSASKSRVIEVEKDLQQTTGLMGDFMDEYLQGFEEETSKISMVFKSIDEEFKGALRSKVGVILGYGGSKKSLYAQSVAFTNVALDRRTLYSNMEMGQSELVDRFFNITFQGQKTLPSTELRSLMKKDYRKDIDARKRDFINMWSDKLIVTNGTAMTSDDYDTLIKDMEAKYGKIDILIVDGLSMMGGKGDEMERANRHSKELKEVAKSHNIFVLVIVHASRGEDLTRRDLSKKARGSEKILDNCDFVMTTSLIKVKNDEYSQMFGVYHLWNKRGSGVRIEKVFKLCDKSLRLEESDMLVRDLEKKIPAGYEKSPFAD